MGKSYYQAHREEMLIKHAAYRASHKEESRSYQRAYYLANREKKKDQANRAYIQRHYDLAPEQINELLAAQGYRCAICRTLTPGGRGRFHLDHDHSCCPGPKSCGKCIRGLLCAACNMALGQLGDDPGRIRAALVYLEGSCRH